MLMVQELRVALEPAMRDMMLQALVVGDMPYNKDGEHADWKALQIKPAHVSMALQVVKKAIDEKNGTSGAGSAGSTGFEAAVEKYVKAQQAVPETEQIAGPGPIKQLAGSAKNLLANIPEAVVTLAAEVGLTRISEAKGKPQREARDADRGHSSQVSCAVDAI